MKAIASVAIAGLIAATSLTTVVTPATAGGKYWKPYPYYGKYYKKGYNRGWNPGAALATGAILGFAFGALAAPNYYYNRPRVYYAPAPPPPYPQPYPYAPYPTTQGPNNAQHVSWCYDRYRSYDAKHNTWIGYDGLVHQCVSPYY